MRKVFFGARLFRGVLGLTTAGVALDMIAKADIGLSPWDAFAMAISCYAPITYGQASGWLAP